MAAISTAKSTLVSRSAATAATGATDMAQITDAVAEIGETSGQHRAPDKGTHAGEALPSDPQRGDQPHADPIQHEQDQE
jgi:hypothetical protein